MNYVIFNADDFGYSRGVNYGIIDSFEQGILRSTTIMANMPGFEQAASYAVNNEGLGVGAHLTLTCGKPLLTKLNTITDENGQFHQLGFYEKDFSIDLDELYEEWDAQIKKIQAVGIKITHLDSHHHVNSIYPINKVFIDLAKKYDLPVRNNFNVPKEIVTTEFFYTKFDSFGFEKEIWKSMTIKEFLEIIKNNKVTEVMCHPAYVDSELMKGSSYTTDRTYSTQELMNLDYYQSLFKENDIKLTNFNYFD